MKTFALPSDLMARVYTDLDGIVLKAIPIKEFLRLAKPLSMSFTGSQKC
jgi:sulfur transfer complex TusBCD TusB component (DsrH family)